MRRRNKIDEGWNAIEVSSNRYEKQKISWIDKYIIKTNNFDLIISKIVKFLISISLFFVVHKKSKTNDYRKRLIVDNTYDLLSSPKFKFIPASVGLYFILSFIPILIIVLSIVSMFPWSSNFASSVLSVFIPGISDMLTTITIGKDTFLNIFSIVFIISLLFFGSKGIVKFNDSFIELYNHKDQSNWITKRLKAIIVVLLIALYFSACALLYMLTINQIKKIAISSNTVLQEFLFYSITLVFLFGFGYLGIGLLFLIISPFKLRWKHINSGILTTLIPTILFIMLFSTIARFLKYEKYGSIGSVIYLIFFLLYISYFLHAGVIVNSAYYQTYYYRHLTYRKFNIVDKSVLICKNIYNKIKYKK